MAAPEGQEAEGALGERSNLGPSPGALCIYGVGDTEGSMQRSREEAGRVWCPRTQVKNRLQGEEGGLPAIQSRGATTDIRFHRAHFQASASAGARSRGSRGWGEAI